MATNIGIDGPGVVYGSAESKEFWGWWGPILDARERAVAQAKAEATFVGRQPEKAAPVMPARLLATPGQSFLPEPDRRAKEALDGFPVAERKPRKPRPDRVRIVDLMKQRHGVCG